MEWVNIFELGEWDVYVSFNGVTGNPSPDSVNYLVKAESLDPRVGSVTVDSNGLIVCDFEEGAVEGFAQPDIIVMPRVPISAPCRLTCSNASGLTTASSAFNADISAVTDEGLGRYASTEDGAGNSVDYASQGQWADPTEAPNPLASGNGMEFYNIAPGGA